MKKQIYFISSFILIMLSSCTSDVDCPGTFYSSKIALINPTEYSIDVLLYPKSVNAVGLYLASDFGGQHLETSFTMDSQQNSNDYHTYTIYSTSDTSASPSYLLDLKFDSIKLTIHNSDNIQVLITPDTIFNLNKNPFKENSAWLSKVVDSAMPTNDCPNPTKTNLHQFSVDSPVN